MSDQKNSTHAQYDEMSATWKKCRDASTGQRAIHKGTYSYLPRLDGQTDEQYKSYLMRALYFNATGRTVEAMRGLAFRKKGNVNLPKGMDDISADITLNGKSLDDLARDVLEDVIRVGRIGLLVDHPQAPNFEDGAKMTVAQAQAVALRPYVSVFMAEDILNWKTKLVGSVTKLVKVMLSEVYEDTDGKAMQQVRELAIIDEKYQQILWRVNDKGEWIEFERNLPTINGKPLTDIPFWFVGPSENGSSVSNPPIEDLVYVNLSHYMNSADLENGVHISGLPTPYVTGVVVDAENPNELHLGSNAAWLLPNTECKAGFVQVGADGFTSIEKAMDRKEQQMAVLGARMIAPEKKAAEAAETASIRRGGENSTLADMVGTVSKKIRDILQFMAKWSGISGEVQYELNKHFLPIPMDAATLTAWVAAVQSGKVSDQTFFEALQAGEVVNENLTFEDEQERIANSAPALGSVGGNGDN